MTRKATIPVLIVLMLVTSGCIVVDEGEVGVSKSFGDINDEPVLQGVAFIVPIARQIEVWNVKLREHKERAQVPSSEGLIVGLDVSLLYRIRGDRAPKLRETIGPQAVVEDQLIVPLLRSGVRDVVSGYPVKNIYTESGRVEIAAKLLANLTAQLEERGVTIENVLLRDVALPERFRESIEAKLTAEQRVQQKQFELEQARKEAEIEVARAEGAAQAQKIIRETLSDSYLQYLWIRTLNQNPNVIYVATEANLPIFKGVRGAQ